MESSLGTMHIAKAIFGKKILQRGKKMYFWRGHHGAFGHLKGPSPGKMQFRSYELSLKFKHQK